MRRTARHIALTLPLFVALSACGSGEPEKPGGVTQDEARALDAAADMLDKRELPDLPEATMPQAGPSNQAGPAPSAS